ncbi:MAG: MATE family efflux transporter [Bacteroidota bacterium]
MRFSDYFPYYKRNLILAYPVILSQLGQVSVSLIDNAMVGRVGTVELAAAAFANNIFMIGMIFGMGITFGLTPLTGQTYGKGELRQATRWLKNGILTYQIAAVVLTLIMVGVYFLLPYLGQTDEVLQASRPYYLWLCASMIPFIAFFTFKQFFEGIGNTRIAMKITLTANLINVLFNYLFIYGKFGFPEMGLTGAGVGTFISRISMPVLFLMVIARNCRYKRYLVLAHHQAIRIKDILKTLKIGIPIALQLIVEMTSFSVGAIMMGWLGEVPLAAHQVAIGLAATTYMISLGISSAATIRVSHQFGIRDFAAMRKAAMASSHLVLVFMSLMGLAFVALRHQLPYLFTIDESVVIIAAELLIVAAFFQVFDGLQVVMLGNLRGMADVKMPMVIAFVAYLGIGLPASWFFAFPLNAGPAGIWYGFLLGLGAAGILFFRRFRRNLRYYK